METAVLCSGLLGLLIFVLGFVVSLTRGQTETAAGSSSDPADRLHKMVRAHGNAAEYAPMLALLMLIAARGDEPVAGWVMWTMILVTACRYLHAIGMIVGPTLEKAHPLRAVGALGTYLGGVILCVAAFMTG
jgi:uncharacterized membrane protein YecN with MAPEG domain